MVGVPFRYHIVANVRIDNGAVVLSNENSTRDDQVDPITHCPVRCIGAMPSILPHPAMQMPEDINTIQPFGAQKLIIEIFPVMDMLDRRSAQIRIPIDTSWGDIHVADQNDWFSVLLIIQNHLQNHLVIA